MITYDEFVDRLRDENDATDIELALMLFCIEDEYGTNDLGEPDYVAALENEGYDEDDEEGTLDDAIVEVANAFYVNAESWSNNYFECNGSEYYVFDDYDDAEEAAKQDTIEIIDDIGYTGINGWEDYVDESVFEEAMQESNEFYCDDIADESSSIYESRLVEECYDNGLIDDDDFETDEDGDPNYEECLVDEDDLKEKLAEYMTENSGYSYASQWYMDNFGEEAFNEFVKRNNAIDVDELAEYVVRSDGVANSLARYDGEENTYEFDGTTYYIYRA